MRNRVTSRGRGALYALATAIPVALLAVFVGYFSRDAVASLVSKDALEGLKQLITVQIALGVLPVTAGAVAVQLAATEINFEAQRSLPVSRRTFLPLLLLLVSVGLDVLLVASGELGMTEPQLSLAVALAIFATGYALVSAHRLMTGDLLIESVLRSSLVRLDGRWLAQTTDGAKSDGLSPLATAIGLLGSCLEKHDADSFARIARALGEHLRTVAEQRARDGQGLRLRAEHMRYEVALDRYLALQMRGLIESSADLKAGWVLEGLVALRQDVEPGPENESGFGPADFRDTGGDLTGLMLPLAVLRGAAREGLEGPVRAAIDYVETYVVGAVAYGGASAVPEVDREHVTALKGALTALAGTYEAAALDALARGELDVARLIVHDCLDLAVLVGETAAQAYRAELTHHAVLTFVQTASSIVWEAARHRQCALRLMTRAIKVPEDIRAPANGQTGVEIDPRRTDTAVRLQESIARCVDSTQGWIDQPAALQVRNYSLSLTAYLVSQGRQNDAGGVRLQKARADCANTVAANEPEHSPRLALIPLLRDDL